jgi:hypothetical protein
MKLAIQISGEFRNLDKAIECLNKNVYSTFQGWDIDIFLHTWKREEDGSGTWPFEGRGDWHTTVKVSNHKTGIELFQPKLSWVEDYEDKKKLKALPRAYSMFYSIENANSLRKIYEEQKKEYYDLVMRYRTDCYLDGNVYELVQPYLKQPRESFLCIPKTVRGNLCDGPVTEEGETICDWFGIGTPDAMDVYCSTYSTFHTVGLPIMPESMLCVQLEAKGITEETILKRPPFDFYLVKGNGDIRGV